MSGVQACPILGKRLTPGAPTGLKQDEFEKGILPIDQVRSWDRVNTEFLIKNADAEFSVGLLNNLLMPDERVGDWGLPGHGDLKATCGSFYLKACFNLEAHPDGLAVFCSHIHRCFSPKCPTCWKLWALRASGRIEERILAFQKSVPSLGKPIHVVASVPKWEYGLDPVKMRKKATSIVKKAHFEGGSGIFHPFREDKLTGLWYFSPHFHYIGFGWIQGTDQIFKSKGWIVKNLGVRKNVFGTAFYQLTHCGVYYGPGRRCSVTWMGALAYNQLKIPKRPKKLDRCAYCGEKMVKPFWDGEGSPPLPCMGLDRFYLAKADNWITQEEILWDWLNPFKDNYHPESSMGLFSYDSVSS